MCRWRMMPPVALLLIPLPLVILLLILSGCALDRFTPPPVSSELMAHARSDRADAQTLSHGRALFVSRCLECHTLPSAAKHSPGEWPHLVSRMAARANLSASEETAITTYLRAASVMR
jgi:mono/diheme cytochrome c family protein